MTGSSTGSQGRTNLAFLSNHMAEAEAEAEAEERGAGYDFDPVC